MAIVKIGMDQSVRHLVEAYKLRRSLLFSKLFRFKAGLEIS